MINRTFFVHIGMPKTATTTIQQFMTVNRDLLRRQGVLYPASIAVNDGHSQLHRPVSVALEPERVPWMASLRATFSNVDIFEKLREEVTQSGAKKIVLSSEALSFLQDPQLLRDALAPATACILVYLRRQDEFLSSLYNQLIKSRLFSRSFEDCLVENRQLQSLNVGEFVLPLGFCNYEKLLGRWAAAFGKDNVCAAIYEDYDLPRGIISHFAEQIGFDAAELSIPEEDTNPRLSTAALALKRRVNARLSGEEERVACEQAFSHHAIGQLRPSPPRPVDRLAALHRRQRILEPYRAGNAAVAKEYFEGRELFAEPTERNSPLPDASEDDWQSTAAEANAVDVIAALVRERCGRS